MAEFFYPIGITEPESSNGCLKIAVYDRIDSSASKLDSHIFLPMPENISSPNTTSWNTAELSLLRESIDSGFGLIEATDAAFFFATHKVLERTVGNFLTKGSNVTAEEALSYAQRAIVNPYMSVIFRGIDLRSFSLGYSFIAFSKEESRTIRDIVKTFRKFSVSPGSAGAANQFMLKYPGEFEIEFIHNETGRTNMFLPKYKRAVCTSVNAEWSTGQEIAQYADGAPVVVTLSLVFQETEVVLRDDIEAGY